jgi:hypothetical protein
MDNIPFMVNSVGPAWLPASAVEARKFAYWGHLFLFIMFVIDILAAILYLVGQNWGLLAYMLISAVVNILLMSFMGHMVFEPLDQGRFREASDHLLIFGVVALVFGPVLPGIFFLLAFATLQGVFQQQYQQYPTQYYQQPQQYPQQNPQYHPPAPAPAPGQPAPQPVQAPPAQGQHSADMTKCKNCGAGYPAFMRNCPNCGTPK